MIARQLKLVSRLQRQSLLLPITNFSSYSHAHNSFDENPHTTTISVNRSMSICLRKNHGFDALDIFKKHLQLGFFDGVSISLALKACRGNPVPGCQIHAFAITSGFTYFISVCNSLMNMYCKAGLFKTALCIFNNVIDPDLVSYNTILSGFRKSEDALGFALSMNLSGVNFDAVTYTTVLAFCSVHEEFLFGLQLHSLITKFGLDCDVFVGNALISMYSRWERLFEARRVFDEMPNKDLVSWNAILTGYTQEGYHGYEAISVFTEMVRQAIKLDHVSFSSALSACGHERNLDFGRLVHGLSIKAGYHTHVSVGNIMTSTYSKCDAVEDAKLVFNNMSDRNVVSWTTMISIDEVNAMSLFNHMRLDGVDPNNVTLIGLIHALTVSNLVYQGLMVHGFSIKSSFSSELNVCNSFITMYAKFESVGDSLKVFGEINKREIITWNALISGYAQNGLCQEALRTFLSAFLETKPNEYTFGSVLSAIGSAEDVSLKYGQKCHSHILKAGLNYEPIVSSALLDMYAKRGSIIESQRVFIDMKQRSQFAWTAMISAHARHGDYESVMNWFKAMERDGTRPDSITFLSILTACGRKGMVDMGRHIFNSMAKDYQIEPSSEHYSCMVDMLGRAKRLEEAEELLGCIPGAPGLSVLQSLLGACRIHGDVERGERVAKSIMELEPTGSGSYVLMSNLYAEKGEWEKVAKLRRGMREKGVRKEVGFSWVDVGEVSSSLSLHGFSSGDMSHPQAEEICKMAKCLGLTMEVFKDKLIKL